MLCLCNALRRNAAELLPNCSALGVLGQEVRNQIAYMLKQIVIVKNRIINLGQVNHSSDEPLTAQVTLCYGIYLI